MIKILIADDHPIVRKGLKDIIKETSDIEVTDEARNGQEVLEKVRKGDFDVVVLDISMPGRSGLEILKELKSEKPKLSVLILSVHPEDQYAIRVLKAGASGYLTKESAPDELITAIRKASLGKKYISYSLAEKIAFDLETGTEKALHEILSSCSGNLRARAPMISSRWGHEREQEDKAPAIAGADRAAGAVCGIHALPAGRGVRQGRGWPLPVRQRVS